MKLNDPIAGVSFRNTKRHLRMKFKSTAVGEEGPIRPDVSVYDTVKIKDAEDHIHPRSRREIKCNCGFPHKPCNYGKDAHVSNYCFKLDG